jgi:XapX domain-containing protein
VERTPLKPYLLSLGAGLLVGVVYALLKVRSPAPPIIALIGLLGILLGEQIPPLARHLWTRDASAPNWLGRQVKPHVFGELPCGPNTSAVSRLESFRR